MDKKTIILVIVIIAILVVFGILIKIAIQAKIYSSAVETTEPVLETMNSQEIEIFNQRFKYYLGTQTGSKVKALISTVNYSNINNDEHYIKCNFNISEIDTTKTYTVSAEYDNYGYISNIIIK